MKSETLAKVFRFVVIVGGILAVVSASYKMIHSPLATGDMESYLHAAHSILKGEDIYATPSRPLAAGGLYARIYRAQRVAESPAIAQARS
jgi:hypothetical protein